MRMSIQNYGGMRCCTVVKRYPIISLERTKMHYLHFEDNLDRRCQNHRECFSSKIVSYARLKFLLLYDLLYFTILGGLKNQREDDVRTSTRSFPRFTFNDSLSMTEYNLSPGND